VVASNAQSANSFTCQTAQSISYPPFPVFPITKQSSAHQWPSSTTWYWFHSDSYSLSRVPQSMQSY